MQIEFSREGVRYLPPNQGALRSIIGKIFRDHCKNAIYIHYIFCNTRYIVSINKYYLNHSFSTDIITFPYESTEGISSDLYICMPQVYRNSRLYGEPFEREMARVIFHGILHLVGYNDLTDSEIIEMREQEEKYLEMYKELLV